MKYGHVFSKIPVFVIDNGAICVFFLFFFGRRLRFCFRTPVQHTITRFVLYRWTDTVSNIELFLLSSFYYHIMSLHLTFSFLQGQGGRPHAACWALILPSFVLILPFIFYHLHMCVFFQLSFLLTTFLFSPTSLLTSHSEFTYISFGLSLLLLFLILTWLEKRRKEEKKRTFLSDISHL